GRCAVPGTQTGRSEVLPPEPTSKETAVSDAQLLQSRRNALKCMAYGGAGTLFVLAGGVFSPVDLALAADDKLGTARLGKPLFVQITDTHLGFNKEANPEVHGTLTQPIASLNGMPER